MKNNINKDFLRNFLKSFFWLILYVGLMVIFMIMVYFEKFKTSTTLLNYSFMLVWSCFLTGLWIFTLTIFKTPKNNKM